MKTASLRIIDRKLGRERAVGQYEHGTKRIEVDPRQTSRERMGTVIHEALHYLYPDASEDEVLRAEAVISDTLWADRYRRMER
jgi:hypothetical protein